MKSLMGSSLYSRILLVEDDRAQLVTLVDIFTEAGFQPMPCANFEELRQQLIEGGFGIAVVDLKLADISGVDAINLIRQANAEAKVIVYTAFGSYESAKEAINLGAFAYVEKAGDINELIGHAHRASHELLVEDLRESEQMFRNFAENINAVFWMRSIEGRLVYISPKCEQIWGMDSVSLKTNPYVMIEYIFAEDRSHVSKALLQLSSDTQPANFDLEYRIQRPGEEIIWIRDRSFSIYDDQGMLLRHAGLAEDITARKHMEQALRESEQRFRSIFEQAAVGVALIESQTGRFVRINGKYSAMIGYGVDEILNTTFMEVTFPDDLREDMQNMEKLKAGAISEFAMEKRLICKDGSVMWVKLTVSPTWKPGEIPAFHIAIVEDITEQKAAAEDRVRHLDELAHAGRLSTMGEMVAEIAHELNQPLYSIANFSEACTNTLLKNQAPQVDRVLKWTTEISRQAMRAGQIIQRLGGFVRKNQPHRSTVDINELIRESAELLSFEARRHQIRVEFRFYEPAPQVLADKIQLQQVIVNLLRNAYEALLENDRSDRQVVITTLRMDSNVIVQVEDNGPGISPAISENIFDAFYSTKQQGMGMGLAISKSILETHDSTLTARSGQTGTVFEFKLAQQNGGTQR